MSLRTPRVEAPRMWSVSDAARALDVAPATVRRLLARGDLPGVRVGARWRVPVDVVDRLRAALEARLARQEAASA